MQWAVVSLWSSHKDQIRRVDWRQLHVLHTNTLEAINERPGVLRSLHIYPPSLSSPPSLPLPHQLQLHFVWPRTHGAGMSAWAPKWVRLATKSGAFSDQISLHFVSMRQKKMYWNLICQSAPLLSQTWHPWIAQILRTGVIMRQAWQLSWCVLNLKFDQCYPHYTHTYTYSDLCWCNLPMGGGAFNTIIVTCLALLTWEKRVMFCPESHTYPCDWID